MFDFFKVSEETFYAELLKDELDIKKIQRYIDKDIDINQKDENEKTVLFPLVAKRKIDAIKILLKNKIDLNHESKYGKTVLDEAIDRSDGMMIRFLLENGASVNRQNKSGRTVMQDVALQGNYKVFQILMGYNPDLNIKDSYGKTILFDAVEGGNLEILKEVINNIETLNTLDEDNQTVLFRAVLKEDNSLAKALILNGININFLDKHGQNVLFNAVVLGFKNFEIIELLLKKGINVNIFDNYNENILDELLYIVNLQAEPKNLEGKYKLIDEGTDYQKIAMLLIENGLEINRMYEDKTILQKAIDEENFINIKFLIDCGADINVTDDEGKSLLSKEIIKGYDNYKIIDFLIENGAKIEQKDIDEKTIVDELVDIILIQKDYKKASPQIESQIKEDGRYEVLLKKILSHRPSIDDQRLDGRNLLFDLVLYNDFDTLRQIINYGVNLNIQDKKGNTPLAYMIQEGMKITDKRKRELFLERLVFLLKFKVNVDIQDNDGKTAHHKAVIADDLTVVEKLLTKKADLTLKDKHGRTALHHTQWNGNYRIARWLIAAGANMNQPDNSGFTLLNYAAIFGHVRLVVTLIASGVLMYNKHPKNRKVAKFFKERENNLQKLLINNINDDKMQSSLEEVVENLKNEINQALI